MSSTHKNLSDIGEAELPNGKGFRIGVVVSEWNTKITKAMQDAAITTLLDNGVLMHDIKITQVPGTFELSLGAQYLCEDKNIDAVIAIGCVIQGETRHFDFICNAVANGITSVSLNYNKPVIFGVLTPHTMQQAEDRAGGKHGNKGVEAASTALKMIALAKNK